MLSPFKSAVSADIQRDKVGDDDQESDSKRDIQAMPPSQEAIMAESSGTMDTLPVRWANMETKG